MNNDQNTFENTADNSTDKSAEQAQAAGKAQTDNSAKTGDTKAKAETKAESKDEAKKPWWKMSGAKEGDKKFGWVGGTFRIVGYTMLFLAAITILVMGMHFGIAFIVGLGLSAIITSCLTYLVGLVAYLTAVFVGWKISGWVNETIDTASKNSAKKESAGPKPAAA